MKFAPVWLLPVTLLLAACGGQAAPSSAPAGSASATAPTSAAPVSSTAAKPAAPAAGKPSAAARKVAMKSAYTTTSATVAPQWATREGGCFDEEGLDVTLTRIEAGAPILSALQGGDVPIAMVGGQQIVEADLKGAEFVLVAGFVDVFAQGIWVIPSIQKPEDLKGKALDVTNFGSISHLAGRVGVEKLGLKGQVNFIAAGGPPEALAAIQAGKVQGAVISPPDNLKAREQGMHELIDVAKLGVKTQTAAVATKRDYAKQNPDIVESYIRAIIKGSHKAKTDKAFGEKAIGIYTKTEDPKILDETYNYYKDLWGKGGFPSLEGLQQNLEAASETIPEAKNAKPEQFVDMTFVNKIKASGLIDQLWGKS